MGKASSSKKVQRAARAAASSRGAGEKRERGFPLLVLTIAVLGVGLVLAARSTRETNVAPLISDHWHSAYEIYDCGELRSALQEQRDPDGIHTHGDSLFHIHPFNSSATGSDARLGVFFDAASLAVTADGVSSSSPVDAGFAPIDNSTGCDGEDSEIVITRWNVDGPDGLTVETTYRGDFADIRFLEEREAFTIAKVPVGEDAPAPSAAVLAQLDSSTGATNLASEGFELPDLPDDPTDDGTTDDGTTDDDGTSDEPATDSGEGGSGSDAG